MQCPICIEIKQSFVANHCGHVACKACVYEYVHYNEQDAVTYPFEILCWGFQCNEKLRHKDVIKTVYARDEYQEFINLVQRNKSYYQNHIPIKGVDHQRPLSAKEVENDELLAALAKKNLWKKCTGCGIFIEKISGCDSISHRKCFRFTNHGQVKRSRGMVICCKCGKNPCECQMELFFVALLVLIYLFPSLCVVGLLLIVGIPMLMIQLAVSLTAATIRIVWSIFDFVRSLEHRRKIRFGHVNNT